MINFGVSLDFPFFTIFLRNNQDKKNFNYML